MYDSSSVVFIFGVLYQSRSRGSFSSDVEARAIQGGGLRRETIMRMEMNTKL